MEITSARSKQATRRLWRQERSSFRLASCCFLLTFILLFALTLPAHAFDEVIDSPMYKDPDPPALRVEFIFPERTKDLWLKALERPDADTRCKAADTIALAHRRGIKGFETTIGPLVAALDKPDQHPAVRLAVARALVTLDAKQAAESLFQRAQADGGELREIVEPALAKWDYRPAREAWLERLRVPSTPQRSLVLAIQSLGAAHEDKAADRLREIVLSDRFAGPIRLEAARALGSLRGEGLEKDAEQLAVDNSTRGIPARLSAAALLQRHSSEAAVRLLQRLSEDAEPAVAAPALARLIEIDPELAVPLVERLFADADPMAAADAQVRKLGIEVLFRRPTEKHLRLLADRLDDVHPEVRVKARKSLEKLADKKELRGPVIGEGTRMLATSQWQGLEQSAILLTLLDHKDAAKRLVELLPSSRAEVAVAAAWGLRKLDVPESLDGVLIFLDGEVNRKVVRGEHDLVQDYATETRDHELSQLNQLLGRQRYQKADAVLQRFIPRRRDHSWPEARAAAIWALGLIHEGKPYADLATKVEARLNDTGTIPPEDPRVRRMSAVTLGRMQVKDTLPSLEATCRGFEPQEDPVSNACGWAIEQMTDKRMPPPRTRQKQRRDWFLLPND